MTRTDRDYRIERLIRGRRSISSQAVLDALEISPATLKLDLTYLRDRLGAPIEYDRAQNGYCISAPPHGSQHELPGLSVSEPELYSLLVTRELLGSLDEGGVPNRHLQPLKDRIREMLGPSRRETNALIDRVVVDAAAQPAPSKRSGLIGNALMRRRRVHLHFLTRSRGANSQRNLSPQRLIYIRGTWYVDA